MSQRVLVVDDDAAILKAVKRALSGAGYEVEVASSGATCLEMLKKQSVDCLLVDLGMPELDGFEVMREALAESLTRSVIVVTERALSLSRSRPCGQSLNFITKPIDFEALNLAIERTTGVPQGSPSMLKSGWPGDEYAPGFMARPQNVVYFRHYWWCDTEQRARHGASGAVKNWSPERFMPQATDVTNPLLRSTVLRFPANSWKVKSLVTPRVPLRVR